MADRETAVRVGQRERNLQKPWLIAVATMVTMLAGTEARVVRAQAAAQFATSPRYMQQLRDRIGSDFGNQNVEAVLKVNVIDGKTGAPSIVAVHVW